MISIARFFLSLRTLFIWDYSYLATLIIGNFLLCAVVFQAFYPYLFIAFISILLLFTHKDNQDIVFVLSTYHIYVLVSILLISLNFSSIVGYSDQFNAYLIPSDYYFRSNYSFLDVLSGNLPCNPDYYSIEILWSKIIYALKYLSIGDAKVALIFNFSLYFLTAWYAYRSNLFNFSLKITQSFFVFTLFAPPMLFINSLYLRESLTASMALLIIVSLVRKNYFILFLSTLILLLTRNVYIIFAIFFILFLSIVFESNHKKQKRHLFIFSFIAFIGYILLFELGISEKFSGYIYYLSGNVSIYSGSTLSQFLDYENLISLQNVFVILIGNIFSPSPFAFLKSFEPKTLLESFFVSTYWLIFLPFFILGALNTTNQKYKVLFLGMFLAIYTSSSFTLLSPAPDTFRYRLPLYGIFSFVSFYGIYQYKILSETAKIAPYKRWFIRWYIGIGLLNIIYLTM